MSKPQRSRPSSSSGLPARLTPAVESPVIGQRQAGDSQSLAVTESGTSTPSEAVTSAVPEAPLYLRLQRKEARLRVDQADALGSLRRQLMRRRVHRGGDAITDNTLLRLAVDLLLTRAGELRGDDEAALRASLGLPELPD